MAAPRDTDFGDFDNFEEYAESLFDEAYGDEFETWDDLEFWEHWSDFLDALYEEYNDQYDET